MLEEEDYDYDYDYEGRKFPHLTVAHHSEFLLNPGIEGGNDGQGRLPENYFNGLGDWGGFFEDSGVMTNPRQP